MKVELNQNEFDALVSLVFNIGTGAFNNSTVLRKLNEGKRREAADAIRMWIKGGAGLKNRRKRERKLFLDSAGIDPLAGFTDTEKRWIREYDRLKAEQADEPQRKVLRRVMTEQRKRIWRAAQDSGWGSGQPSQALPAACSLAPPDDTRRRARRRASRTTSVPGGTIRPAHRVLARVRPAAQVGRGVHRAPAGGLDLEQLEAAEQQLAVLGAQLARGVRIAHGGAQDAEEAAVAERHARADVRASARARRAR